MYLVIIFLNKEEYLDDLLSSLVELGIEQAAIVDAQSMSTVLATHIPIFASLRLASRHPKAYCKTVFAVSESMKEVKDLPGLLRSAGMDPEKDIRIVLVKTEAVFGNMDHLI